MRNKNTRKGFTTVELVIVIAVIAILATVLIPTFSNMIEAANLSVDKQNVRNMNICLQTYSITDGNPSDAGSVKAALKEYGYGNEDNFAAKTKGHSIWWYTTDNNTPDDKSDDISAVLLLNAANEVVFPEEYVNLHLDFSTCFNLSAPLASVKPLELGSQYFALDEIEGLINEVVKPLMDMYKSLTEGERQAFEDAFNYVLCGGAETRNGFENYFVTIRDEMVFGTMKIGDIFSKQFRALADNFDGTFGKYADGEESAALENVKKAFSYAMAAKYEFEAESESENYNDWTTTFFVSVELPEELKGKEVSLALAGYYYAEGVYTAGWQLVTIKLREGEPIDLLKELAAQFGLNDAEFTYEEVRKQISPFKCGVVDLMSLSNVEKLALFKNELDSGVVMPSDVELTVELRLTNGAGDKQTVGVYKYTFPKVAQIVMPS